LKLTASLKFVRPNGPASPTSDKKGKRKCAARSNVAVRNIAKEVKDERPVSAREARESVLNCLRSSALEAAKGVVRAAKKGQLAQAKLLFEMAGIYPASEEATAGPRQEMFIETLLRKVAAEESMTEESGEGQPPSTTEPQGEDTVK
jgi:hypothetical protein